MNEDLDNARSLSPYCMNFEDFPPNSPPFHEHMDHTLLHGHPHDDHDDNIPILAVIMNHTLVTIVMICANSNHNHIFISAAMTGIPS